MAQEMPQEMAWEMPHEVAWEIPQEMSWEILGTGWRGVEKPIS